MVGAAVGQIDIAFGIVGLLDAGVHFRAVEQAAEAVELRDIDEFPLYELLVLVVEPVLLLLPESPGFSKGLFFVVGGDQAELFVKLRGMVCLRRR